METLTIDLSRFTDMERQSLEAAAAINNMTLEQYVAFLIQGVATPKQN